MENVGEPALRRFSTARFFQDGLGHSLDDWTGARVGDRFGALIEKVGWHALGEQIGYFDAAEPLIKTARYLIARSIKSLGDLSWPTAFRKFAFELAAGEAARIIEQDVSYGDPETLAIFQAAMTVAEGFTDPLVSSLQLSLHASDSVLDGEQEQVDGEEVLTALEQFGADARDRLESRQSWPQSVAGLFGLIELLSAFDQIFPDANVEPRNPKRAVIGRATADLLSWRLNLWDERTIRRLRVVSDAFWHVCEFQLRLARQSGIRWSSSQSHEAWAQMLVRWRGRGTAEKDRATPNLEQFAKEEQTPLKPETPLNPETESS